MSMSQDNQAFADASEKAFEIYDASVNKPTSIQRHCVEQLKELYKKFSSDEVANFYANALFNLSLRVPEKDMQSISTELENLFQANPTEDIAERIGRIKFNLSGRVGSNARELNQYAGEIEDLYNLYPTKALAEPLAKIWYSIFLRCKKYRPEYAKKIIELCKGVSDPETNTAYARVLFDPKVSIENRDELIGTLLTTPQALDSLRVYVESSYYPQYNKLFENFQLCSSYPTESIGKRMNHYLSRLKRNPSYIDLKVELLALLYYAFEIRRLLIVPNISVPMGHYTKIENLKYLVLPGSSGGKLRMSNACYMNDPSEGQALLKNLVNKSPDFSDLLDKQSYNIYLSCFTTAIDELPMWSMYGNDGKGCCLLFKRDFFDFTSEEFSDELMIDDRYAGENNFLFRVAYLSSETNEVTIDTFPQDDKALDQKLADAIGTLQFHLNKIGQFQGKKRDKVVDDILAFILGQIRYLFKDDSYAHEHELRLIRYSEKPQVDNESWVVPQLFVEVEKPLEYAQIILGPKVEQTNRIIPYLIYTGKVKEVKTSKIKYR